MAPRRRPGPPEPKTWAHALTQQVGRNVEHFRRERGMQILELGEACANLEHSVGRMSISSLEAGTRESVPLAEVIVLAAALNVAPADLIFRELSTALPPGAESATDESAYWFVYGRPGTWSLLSGEATLLLRHADERFRFLNALDTITRHAATDEEIDNASVGARSAGIRLLECRSDFFVRELTLPELPPELRILDSPSGENYLDAVIQARCERAKAQLRDSADGDR